MQNTTSDIILVSFIQKKVLAIQTLSCVKNESKKIKKVLSIVDSLKAEMAVSLSGKIVSEEKMVG